MNTIIEVLKRIGYDIVTSGTGNRHELGLKSRIIFLNSVTLLGAAFIAAFSYVGFAANNVPLGCACATASLLVCCNFAFIRRSKRFMAGSVIDCAVIFVFYYYLVLSGGEGGSGFLWIMTYPLITLFLLGGLAGSLVSLGFGLCVAVALFVPSLNAAKFSFLYSLRIVGAYVFIVLFALVYELVRKHTLGKLEESNGKLTRATADLVAEKKQTDDILYGVREGIFLLRRDLTIGDAHSRFLEAALEDERLAGRNFLELIGPRLPERDLQATKDYFGIFFGDKVNDALLAEINPLEEAKFTFGEGKDASEKYLRFTFHRLDGSASAYPVLATVVDATEEVRLKQRIALEDRAHRQSIESLFQIIHVDPAMMREFIADTEAELEDVNDLMRDGNAAHETILEALYQGIHSIKGNALLLGLEEFSVKVHEFEGEVKQKRDGKREWRDLLELTIGLGKIRGELDSLKSLIDKILSFQSSAKKGELADATLFERSISKFVSRESERTGIPAAVAMQGFGSRGLPEGHRKIVKDMLVQLIRNSFAHGFEAAQERAERNKPSTCRIDLSVDWNDDHYVLKYRDDGRGLDPARIRERANAIPALSGEASNLSDAEIARLIFHPGFSTANEASLGAGRGIGMSLVRSLVGQAGGKLSLKSAQARGLEFAIKLPLGKTAPRRP